jgi:cellulose synthase/poly-beta-1,6-N-acetylglucosamine synthase-like glycosyltransferase
MEVAFWVCVVWVVYAFVGYPLGVFLLARFVRRGVGKADATPSVTVLIAAYNEVRHIVATVVNKLEQDYPADRLNVVVVSDESEDGTDEAVRQLGENRVRLIRQTPRQGKTAGLNLAMPTIDSDIVVFSDANSIYAPDAVRQLVRNFADPEVGYVTGRMVYRSEDGSAVGEGCSTFMRFENWLRGEETKLGSVVGVDGGVDAVRRDLYRPMGADQLPDFVLPLKVREQGYRVVYEPAALLGEDALAEPAAEFRMRVRVSLRALWTLWDLRGLLNPFRYGLFSWQLFSHKVLRYTAFLPLLALLPLSVALSGQGAVYQLAFLAQVVFYLAALLGALAKSPGSLLGLPWYFVLVNVAAGKAFWKFLRGEKQVIWQPRVGA